MGDRLATLRQAVAELDARPGIEVRRSSRVYETAPVGGPPQPDFLNAVIEVETSLSPVELLQACLGVEASLGRTREARWGPRPIDVDVLTFDQARVRSEDPPLEVPHPRMHERAFVLAPLLELEPDPMLPGDATVGELTWPWGAVRLFAPPLPVTDGDGGSPR